MELIRYPVHRALTRPQMFAGVTYTFFVINGIGNGLGDFQYLSCLLKNR